MRNLQRTKSIVANDDTFGIIAHHLMKHDSQMSFRLDIDPEKKKIAIASSINIGDARITDINVTVKFEWNFQE